MLTNDSAVLTMLLLWCVKHARPPDFQLHYQLKEHKKGEGDTMSQLWVSNLMYRFLDMSNLLIAPLSDTQLTHNMKCLIITISYLDQTSVS